jgi:hypothetical protein
MASAVRTRAAVISSANGGAWLLRGSARGWIHSGEDASPEDVMPVCSVATPGWGRSIPGVPFLIARPSEARVAA